MFSWKYNICIEDSIFSPYLKFANSTFAFNKKSNTQKQKPTTIEYNKTLKKTQSQISFFQLQIRCPVSMCISQDT